METIFHEKQEGYLCAQHCLNALLQGPYFTPVELATLAQQMDDEERIRMAESGVDSEEYRLFLEQPSGNMDDSGYFSVQVINSALGVWGLELVPYNSTEPRAIQAQENPDSMIAYICNYRDHWFTIRQIGSQWFNLNSMLSGPELISNTYLVMFLAQLQQEGYSIFVVFGNLPECAADDIIRANPVVRAPKPVPVIQINDKDDDDPELKKALMLSLGQNVSGNSSSKDSKGSVPSRSGSDGDLELALKMSLGQVESPSHSFSQHNCDDVDEDPELERALRLSLECTDESLTGSSIDVDVAEIRRRQLNYLSNIEGRASAAKLNS